MRSSGHSLQKPSQRVPVLGSLFAIVATWRRAVVASRDRDKSGTDFALCRLVTPAVEPESLPRRAVRFGGIR